MERTAGLVGRCMPVIPACTGQSGGLHLVRGSFNLLGELQARQGCVQSESLSEKKTELLGVMVCTFGPSTLKAEAGDLCEFEVSLVYRVSSR